MAGFGQDERADMIAFKRGGIGAPEPGQRRERTSMAPTVAELAAQSTDRVSIPDAMYRQAAIGDGIQVDDDAVVSRSAEGAYVAAWVWVPREDAEPGQQ